MANEIYHRTNWGEAKPEGFGDIYFDPSATNKLYNRSTYYENSDATDKILGDIPNKASIVLTPTGYSEDSINTAIPPYQVLPTNIVTNGTFDTDSDWTKESTAGYIIQTNILELGKKYKLNATVEEGVVSLISAFYDVEQGTNIQTGTSSIFTVTSGTDLRLYSHPSNGNASITDITVQEIQEADFTFARNSSATRVNQAGLIEASQSNDTPRLDYTTGQGAFLLEPQSTNLITYSEDFSQWSANSGASVVTNNAISPDGTQNASTFTFDGTTNGRVELLTDGVTSSEDVTFSVYLKTLSGTEQVSIGHSSFGFLTVTVDDQWKRYTSTATASASFAYPRVRIDSATSVLVWGYQLEQQSYATSYIPTVGSTVTRSAETSVGSGNSDLFNDSEGVLLVEISALFNGTTTKRAITLKNDDSSSRISIIYNTDSTLAFYLSVSPSVYYSTSAFDINDNLKIAFKYKTNDFAGYINGLEVFTDTSNDTFSADTLTNLSLDESGTNSPFFGRTKRIALFKEALTDIELEKLTSWRDFRDLAESQQYTLVTIKSDAIVVSAYGTTSGGGGVSGGGSGGGGGY